MLVAAVEQQFGQAASSFTHVTQLKKRRSSKRSWVALGECGPARNIQLTPAANKDTVTVGLVQGSHMHVPCTVGGVQYKALVDTGTTVTHLAWAITVLCGGQQSLVGPNQGLGGLQELKVGLGGIKCQHPLWLADIGEECKGGQPTTAATQRGRSLPSQGIAPTIQSPLLTSLPSYSTASRLTSSPACSTAAPAHQLAGLLNNSIIPPPSRPPVCQSNSPLHCGPKLWRTFTCAACRVLRSMRPEACWIEVRQGFDFRFRHWAMRGCSVPVLRTPGSVMSTSTELPGGGPNGAHGCGCPWALPEVQARELVPTGGNGPFYHRPFSSTAPGHEFLSDPPRKPSYGFTLDDTM
ncbi:UNVERIFIED_CONTAM: hypothetical protein FKN15_077161 [Acipenser sinensis]